MWKLINSIHTFNAVAPPDGLYIYEQETDTFSLIDYYFVNNSIYSLKIPKSTKFIVNGDMVSFNLKVPVFYFLNSAINNFRMVNNQFISELRFNFNVFNCLRVVTKIEKICLTLILKK